MKNNASEAHVAQATEWYEANVGRYMNVWVEEQVALELRQKDVERIRAKNPGEKIQAPDVFLYDRQSERAMALREADFKGLMARSRDRIIASHALGYAEIEVRANERRRIEDLAHTCPVCGEIRPDAAIARRLEVHDAYARDLNSCWACFVTARDLLRAEAMTPARVASVRKHIGAL